MWDTISISGNDGPFIRATPTTSSAAVKATTRTITKHSMPSSPSTLISSVIKRQQCNTTHHQPLTMSPQPQSVQFPTGRTNSIPRSPVIINRQLSLTLWKGSTTSNNRRVPTIEAAQLGGSMGYCRFFVNTLPHTGGFWFKEPLQNILGLNNNPGIINCSLITDAQHRQWPQYFITRRSMNTSNSFSAFNTITNAIKNYVAGSNDDATLGNVKWKLTVKEKELSSADVSCILT